MEAILAKVWQDYVGPVPENEELKHHGEPDRYSIDTLPALELCIDQDLHGREAKDLDIITLGQRSDEVEADVVVAVEVRQVDQVEFHWA